MSHHCNLSPSDLEQLLETLKGLPAGFQTIRGLFPPARAQEEIARHLETAERQLKVIQARVVRPNDALDAAETTLMALRAHWSA